MLLTAVYRNFDVAFPSAKLASIAARSVAVDEEVRPDRVKRSIVAEENVVKMYVHRPRSSLYLLTSPRLIPFAH